MKISKKKDYLLLTLSIEILTLEIVKDAIKLIAEKSSEYKLQFFTDKTAALKWLSSIDTSPSSIG